MHVGGMVVHWRCIGSCGILVSGMVQHGVRTPWCENSLLLVMYYYSMMPEDVLLVGFGVLGTRPINRIKGLWQSV